MIYFTMPRCANSIKNEVNLSEIRSGRHVCNGRPGQGVLAVDTVDCAEEEGAHSLIVNDHVYEGSVEPDFVGLGRSHGA